MLLLLNKVKLDLYKEAIKCLKTTLSLAIGQPNVENRNNSISAFVKSLESTLRQFSGRHLAIAKKRINDVIFYLEMECFTPQSTPVSASSSPSTDLLYHPQGSSSNFNDGTLNWAYLHWYLHIYNLVIHLLHIYNLTWAAKQHNFKRYFVTSMSPNTFIFFHLPKVIKIWKHFIKPYLNVFLHTSFKWHDVSYVHFLKDIWLQIYTLLKIILFH